MTVNVDLPKVSGGMVKMFRERLHEYKNGNLSWDEFRQELAYASLNDPIIFQDLRYRPLPTPPMEFETYYGMRKFDKDKFLQTNPEFFQYGAGIKYLDELVKVINMNDRNREWLDEMIEIFKPDLVSLAKAKRLRDEHKKDTYPYHKAGQPESLRREPAREPIRQPAWHD